MEKLKTYLLGGKEVPEGTPGAAVYETDPIAPETGLYQGGMTKGSCNYRTALFVDGGKVQESQSVPAAITGGSFDGSGITGGVIDSDNRYFNGVMVNDTDFAVTNLTMTADGSGISPPTAMYLTARAPCATAYSQAAPTRRTTSPSA